MKIKALPSSRESGSSHFPQLVTVTARLPPELCDMVIDFLHEDKITLANCTTVCRSWLRPARYHLFATIYVNCEKDLDAFSKFLAYLKSTPSVLSYIKDLCFDGYNDDPNFGDNLESSYLAAVLAHLPLITTISVINCQWGRTKPLPDVISTPQRQVSLRSLYINSFVADRESPKNKLRVLRQFSSIGNLYLANVWLGHFGIDDDGADEAEPEGGVDLLPMTRVKTLSISMANICLNFLEYLRIQPFMKSLASLRVIDLFHAKYLLEHQDLTFVGDLLREQLNTSLREIYLELPRLSPPDTARVYERLDLSSCTALTSVTLRMSRRSEAEVLEAEEATQNQGTQVDEEEADEPQPEERPTHPTQVDQGTQTEVANPWPIEFGWEEWQAPVVILSQLPSNVKAVCLEVELMGKSEVVQAQLNHGLPWHKLEAALVNLPTLEKVVIRRLREQYPCAVQWTRAQRELIARGLPVLRDRGILHLDW